MHHVLSPASYLVWLFVYDRIHEAFTFPAVEPVQVLLEIQVVI